MKVVILAGGMGTRLQEETVVKPKPMVEIGGKPILWHIMQRYAAFGHKEFVVALGYLGGVIKNYFLNYYHNNSSFSIDLRNGDVEVTDTHREDWSVHLVDTGSQTETGGRLRRLSTYLGGERFMATYGDGVADIELDRLLEFHESHGGIATVTAVRPPARFGGIALDGHRVARFAEKPQIGEGWINGGFFVLEPEVFDFIDGDDVVFEREPLERLAARGQLYAFRQEGFWQCMDTVRDVLFLENLWQKGRAPWSPR